MKLSIGIVGLPNVGKSTLFKILTEQEVHVSNYPFTTIDPNVGVVVVPDERLEKLGKLTEKKTTPAVVEFYDIAGLVKNAHKGEGLGNQFLAHIRETQAIVIILRTFQNPEIVHVENSIDPLRDLETINAELILKDLETVGRRLEKVESEARSGVKFAIRERDELRTIKAYLEAGKLLSSSKEAVSMIEGNPKLKGLNLLTAKRQLYLLNGKDEAPSELIQKIKEVGARYIIVDLATTVVLPELIKKAYEVLSLISFFTIGEDETRAWTIVRGTRASQAAGKIHSDFEKKFIRAEVISWNKLLDAGGWKPAQQQGSVRPEGKEYVVEDGDVIRFKI